MVDEGRERACRKVYERFPELAGVKPSVQIAGKRRVYTFRASHAAEGGRVAQIVRATVDGDGKIVKLVASR